MCSLINDTISKLQLYNVERLDDSELGIWKDVELRNLGLILTLFWHFLEMNVEIPQHLKLGGEVRGQNSTEKIIVWAARVEVVGMA